MMVAENDVKVTLWTCRRMMVDREGADLPVVVRYRACEDEWTSGRRKESVRLQRGVSRGIG